MVAMLVEIQWQDKTHRAVLCRIEGEWSYSGYNHTYMQLIQYAREVPSKINLLCDVTNANALIEDVPLLRVSPFIHLAVIISNDIDNPIVKQIARMLHNQNPALLLSHAPGVEHAMIKVRRTESVGT
jgi:hypothetical protein